MDNNSAIRLTSIAYKAGLHSSLNEGTWSAYNEITKWRFEGTGRKLRLLKAKFLIGYSVGLSLLKEVREDNLLAGTKSPVEDRCDSTVQGPIING